MRLATLAAALLILAGARQDLPAVTDRHGAFAFASGSGAEIIVLHPIENPDRFRNAVCGGRVVPVRFARRQERNAAARDDPREFERLRGTVFAVNGRRAGPGETCFVAAGALLESAEVLGVRMSAAPADCARDARERFAAVRNRRIKACWTLGTVEPQGTLGAVEYERSGRDALASLVVFSAGRTISIDFPAEYKGEGEDLWRVDDGGVFSPNGFAVPFVLRRAAGAVVPVEWRGSEGVSLSIFVADAAAPAARKVLQDYWYRAPR
jgi:hypothetical protein